jgi:DNA-binding NtrC family response regulator
MGNVEYCPTCGSEIEQINGHNIGCLSCHLASGAGWPMRWLSESAIHEANSKTKSRQHPKVLIVEDQGLLRMAAVGIMEDSGFEALEATNAEEALRILEDHSSIAVVFTDIDLSAQKNGVWLAEQINRRWPAIDVIVTSGYPRPDNYNPDNVIAYHEKPYSEEEVVKQIQKAVFGSRR